MLFSSLTFIFFLIPYVFLHYLLPVRYRNLLIIIGSSIFYAWWKPALIWIPFCLIAIAYAGYNAIQVTAPTNKKKLLFLVIALLCLPLLVYKYSNFILLEIISPLLGTDIQTNPYPIPLGISFITFTLIAFVVDSYNNRIKYKVSLTTFASYILFFPQLIAGPILRSDQLIPQLIRNSKARLTSRRFQSSLGIFTLGFIKKLVFADQIAIYVDKIYSATSIPSFQDTLLCIYGFSVQIYCDFSGYIDMAVGVSLLLGVKLPVNFKKPYISYDLADFWRRWHITLSNWLRDYIYIPLGGNRVTNIIQSRNLLFTMIVGGIWHGANWTFLLWGIFHGLGLTITHLLKIFSLKSFRISTPLRIFLTFHIVSFSWVLFRSTSIHNAINIYSGLFTISSTSYNDLTLFVAQNLPIIILVFTFFVTHHLDDWSKAVFFMRKTPPEVKYPLLLSLLILCLSLSHGSSGRFIYFDF
ncbi:MBOAT family O-acyltransferase [Prochlorococcus sp. MIT 1341]|uniref:MBOAT family O-acyltransferase n=1 Tax=Prochlorococcus sp. MIT 1341 TaxID=3096221 RepID=UPI002A749FAD|nr:MBOAT family O-acyltransferase [Prochlorococcus sp. MIT 1341]